MIWKLLLIAALFVGVYLLLIYPGKTLPGQLKGLTGRTYAHRGLHSKHNGVPENSLKAFEVAAHHGYGIELDVRLSSDGEVIVFHDETLMRLCNLSNAVETLTASQLTKLRIQNSDQFIPTLHEALQSINGAVPIILDLKQTRRRSELCKRTAELLDHYTGTVCVASFDPRTLSWFKRNRKILPRMQKATAQRFSGKNRIMGYFSENLMGNLLSRPQIVAYEHEFCSNRHFRRCVNTLGATACVWTVDDQNAFDNMTKLAPIILFEGIFPRTKYDNTVKIVRGHAIRND